MLALVLALFAFGFLAALFALGFGALVVALFAFSLLAALFALGLVALVVASFVALVVALLTLGLAALGGVALVVAVVFASLDGGSLAGGVVDAVVVLGVTATSGHRESKCQSGKSGKENFLHFFDVFLFWLKNYFFKSYNGKLQCFFMGRVSFLV
jgi:hypothetical protein